MNTFYNTDLALVHDWDFSHIARDAANYLITNAPGKKIVDLGCGSGTLAGILSNNGFDVIGVDYSTDMIRLAEVNVPQAAFIESSIFDFTIPSTDIVSLIGEVVCYLFDHKSDYGHLAELFTRIYKHLRTPGMLIFDFLTPAVVTDGHLAKRIIERENWSMFVSLDKDAANEILTRDITLFFKTGKFYRRSQEIHRQRLYDPERLKQILQELGFVVDFVQSYGDDPFRTGHLGIIARKNE
ncbi:MAG: class I SAM-dependent methyltransferase [Saprospiraceae bacterium]|nr:class I SAM-dependent methyltransferase [Saprospiraceae bacterium]